ncbi:hypothetical protein ACFSKU_06805, partial [Pontibacter silvestris]
MTAQRRTVSDIGQERSLSTTVDDLKFKLKSFLDFSTALEKTAISQELCKWRFGRKFGPFLLT